jgi:hypothetical protein
VYLIQGDKRIESMPLPTYARNSKENLAKLSSKEDLTLSKSKGSLDKLDVKLAFHAVELK